MRLKTALLLCVLVTHTVRAQETAPPPAPQLSREQLDRTVDETLTLIEKNFMKEMSREEIVQRALTLLLQDLDPYSRYLSPTDRADFEAMTAARFAGFGVQLMIDADAHLPRITYLMLDSPARDAGVRRGDLLLRVDGHDFTNWTMDQVINTLRGAPGTVADVLIRRDGVERPLPVRITRREIKTPSVRGVRRDAEGRAQYMLDAQHGIGYIRISRLAADTVAEVERAMIELQKQNARGVIVDLRDCVGGLMRAAVDTADLFLDKGKIVTVIDRHETELYDAAPGRFIDIPMVVLINDGTVSSGEILAGALKDNNRATFIGGRTFGKGRVQNHFKLGDGLGSIILSTGTFQRPSGKTIDRHDVADGAQDAGIEPDIAVSVDGAELDPWRSRMELLDSAAMLTDEEQQAAPDRILDLAVKTLIATPAPASRP